MSLGEWVLIGVGVLFFLAGLWAVVRRPQPIPPPPLNELTATSAPVVAWTLYRQYLGGIIDPDELARAAELAPPPGAALAETLNRLICVEVAAGRYREALEWRARWPGPHTTEAGEVMVINEAEALACLGRFEESLAWLDAREPSHALSRSGAAAHRAWVLSEMGRIEEARAALREPGASVEGLPADYRAEFHFAAFAVAFAARDWAEAAGALSAAGRVLARESSFRNHDFYRGRLALALGDAAGAIAHFERGGRSPYRRQGGASLLEWGDALAQLGRPEEARDPWQRCLAEDPQSPAAALAASRLKISAEREPVPASGRTPPG